MDKSRKVIVGIMIPTFIIGIILFVYPFARGLYLDQRMQDNASSFLEQVHPMTVPQIPDNSKEPIAEEPEIPNRALWDAVQAYNRQIWQERQADLCDPWSYQQPSFSLGDFGLEDEIFAVVSIPSIEVEMPIYLGATTEHLSLGAAHLSQTSLPVGGNNCNCVIAGHRGWHNGRYFADIVSLKIGDEIIVANMWEQLTYRVVETSIIESYEVDRIKIQEDRDLVTLLTCYYCGNNHKMRYAVYCERVTE